MSRHNGGLLNLDVMPMPWTGNQASPLCSAGEKRHLVIDLNTGKARPAISRRPVLSSVAAPWQGVSLEQHRSGPAETVDVAAPGHVIIVQLKHTASCEFRGDSDRFQPVQLQPGQVAIVSAMAPHSARTENTGEFMAVRLEPKFLLCAAHELVEPARFALTTTFGLDDPLLRAGALALKAEAECGFLGGRVYGESVAATLAVHLARHYAIKRLPASGRNGGLPRTSLRRVIDFAHAHLGSDISLGAMADVAGLSPYHFARLFKKSTGLAPHQFVVRARVERAKELLLVNGAGIADVALKVGFCDQSHLTAHFKRIYGITPKEFCRQSGRG